MKIQDIENLKLCCGYCKGKLLYYNNSANYFRMVCLNNNCINCQNTVLSGSFDSNNIIRFCQFSFKNWKTFYFDKHSFGINPYQKNIKLESEDFLILLKDYSKDFDIEKLENKFDTLELLL